MVVITRHKYTTALGKAALLQIGVISYSPGQMSGIQVIDFAQDISNFITFNISITFHPEIFFDYMLKNKEKK